MSVSGDALWTGIVGLAGTGLGAFVSYVATSRAWRRSEASVVVGEIALLRDVAWNDMANREAVLHITSLRFKLALLGVKPSLIDGLMNTTWKCRDEFLTDQLQSKQRGLDEAGISGTALDAFTQAQDAVANALRRG